MPRSIIIYPNLSNVRGNMYTHRDYVYRANRLIQALRQTPEGSEVSFLIVLYSKEFGFDSISKSLLSYLLEGTVGYSSFITTQELDDIALCVDIARGAFSWYFPTPELLEKYKYIVASIPNTYVYVGFTSPIILDSKSTDFQSNPYSLLRVSGCRSYPSVAVACEASSFPSSIFKFESSDNVLDVPLLAFLRNIFIPTQYPIGGTPSSSPASLSAGSIQLRVEGSEAAAPAISDGSKRYLVYNTIERTNSSGNDSRYIDFLYNIPFIDLKPLPITALYKCFYHLDACSANTVYRAMQSICVEFTECINRSRTLMASLPSNTPDISALVASSISEPLQTSFKNKRTHYLDICHAMRAASATNGFFNKENATKYYPLTLMASKDKSGGSIALPCGGVLDIGLVHPMYPLQFRRSVLIEPPKTMLLDITEVYGVPLSALHSFYYIAGSVVSQMPRLVALLLDELGLGHKLYAKPEDLTSVVDSSMNALKNKISGALTTAIQANNFPVDAGMLKHAISLTSNAIKISCEQYNLGLTKAVYGRGLYHVNLAVQVRFPYDSAHILALTLVHGDTVMPYPGGYCLLGADLSSSQLMTLQLNCSDNFVFRELANLPDKQQKQTNLVCNLRLLHYVSINNRKFLFPSLLRASLPCLLHFDSGFHLTVWLKNLGSSTLNIMPNQKSQAFASVKTMYSENMKEFYRYKPLFASSESNKAFMLFTRILTVGEKCELEAHLNGSGSLEASSTRLSIENIADYADNDLTALAHVVGYTLTGDFATSIDMTSRIFKTVVTTAIRLLINDSGIQMEDALSKLRHLSTLYNANYINLGFVQMYEPANTTASYGFKTFKKERGEDFVLDGEDLPQTIIQEEDLLSLIWDMAKAVCKEANLQSTVQDTAMSVVSREKLANACMMHGLLCESSSRASENALQSEQDMSIVTTKALLEESSKKVEQQDSHAFTVAQSLVERGDAYKVRSGYCFKEGIRAIAIQDALKLQAAMGIQVSEKLIIQAGTSLDCVDTLCLTKKTSAVGQSVHINSFCDKDSKLKSNNHVVLMSGFADISNSLVSLFSAALQSELNGASRRLTMVISRSLDERSFLSDMVGILPTLTNTVIIGQISGEGSMAMLLECIAVLSTNRYVTTIRHISLSNSLIFNIHCMADVENRYKALFSPLLVPDWTRMLVVITEPGAAVNRSAASSFSLYPLSTTQLSNISTSADPRAMVQNTIKNVALVDNISVQSNILFDSKAPSSDEQLVIHGLTLPGNQVTDICAEIARCILKDVDSSRCDMLSGDHDLFLLFSERPLTLRLDCKTMTMQKCSSKYYVIQQIDSAYTDAMLRRSLGGMRRIVETKQSIRSNLLPKIFTCLLSASDKHDTQGNIQIVLNFCSVLFIELTTCNTTISIGRYNIDNYSTKKFFPNLSGKITILSSEPGAIFEQPTLSRLLSSLIEEIFRELFVELAPTVTEIKGYKGSADPLHIDEDLNTLIKENISWDIVREYYDDEKLPPGWYYDGIKYISMDGERSNERPDKKELMKRFLDELEAKTLKPKNKAQAHEMNPVTDGIENDILKLNIKDDIGSDSEIDNPEMPFVANTAVPEAKSVNAPNQVKNPISTIASALKEETVVASKKAVYAKSSLPISRDAAILRPAGARTGANINSK